MIIVWTVLKVIGIILLVIVLLIAALLFAPVTYEASGNIDKQEYQIRLSCLLRLLVFRFSWISGAMQALLRILFFKIDFTDAKAQQKRAGKKKKRQRRRQRRKEEKKNRKKKKIQKEHDRNRKKINLEAKDSKQTRKTSDSCEENSEETQTENVSAPQSVAEKQIKKASAQNSAEGKTAKKTSEQKESQTESETPKSSGIRDAFGKLKNGALILKSVHESGMVEVLIPKLQIFLIRIRPRRLQGRLEFGMEDPAVTGQILGALSVIPFLFLTDLEIIPDFETEESYLRGNFYMKGRVFGIHLLIFGIQIWKNPQIRKWVKARRK